MQLTIYLIGTVFAYVLSRRSMILFLKRRGMRYTNAHMCFILVLSLFSWLMVAIEIISSIITSDWMNKDSKL